MRVLDRFLAKVRVQEDGCWIWTAAGHPTGYGRFGMSTGHVDFAHRASWRLHHGPIPSGKLVCHRCDVRLCVNPAHLFLGSHAENMQDASRKGRIVLPSASYASDETHQVAKLTNAQVLEIRNTPPGTRGLAKKFGVSRSAIWLARQGHTFRDVPCV
jgi:hypothetical protein